MATRQVRTDDIDGSDATHSVAIIIGEVRYNLDLNDEHFEQFKVETKAYTDAAEAKRLRLAQERKSTAKKSSPSEPAGKIVITMPDGSPVDRDAARIWAKDHGYPKIGFFVGPSILEEYRDWLVAGGEDDDPEEEEPEGEN